MERIVRVNVPLFCGEEVAHVGDDLGLGLCYKVLDGLYKAVLIGDG